MHYATLPLYYCLCAYIIFNVYSYTPDGDVSFQRMMYNY